jgi:hypothetical protein
MIIEKKANGKGKAKGKVILGIAMAAIMLASVFVAMVPTATAVAPWVTVDKVTCGTTLNVPVDYTFTITNNDAFAQTFTINYPVASLTGGWIGTAVPFTTANIAAGGTGTFTLTFTPTLAGDTPINVPVTVTADTSGDATTKTIGCYMTPLTYNGLSNVINVVTPGPPVKPDLGPSNTVLIGQDLDLGTLAPPALKFPTTIKGDPTSDATAGQIFQTDAAGMFDSEAMTVSGTYYVNSTGGTSMASPDTAWATLEVADPTMNLDLRVSGTSVSSITQGTPLQIRFANNLGSNDMVTLRIIDPNGDQIKSTQPPICPSTQKFSKINVRLIYDVYYVAGIDTTDWKVGTYTFQVKTAKTVAAGQGARGLDASSGEKTLAIVKSEIGISADNTTVVEEERVRLTVTGVTGHVITIDSSDWGHTLFPGGLDDNKPYDVTASFADTIDADGKRTYCVEFDETGPYTITVTDITAGKDDTVDITVTEKGKVLVSVSTDKIDYQSGDIMETTITMTNTFNTSKTVTLYWWLTIPQFDYMTVMLVQPFVLPSDYNSSLIIPVSIGEWGDSAFGAVWSVGFFDNENKIVAWDMAGWNYVPSKVAQVKKSPAAIAEEITKEIGRVELPS